MLGRDLNVKLFNRIWKKRVVPEMLDLDAPGLNAVKHARRIFWTKWGLNAPSKQNRRFCCVFYRGKMCSLYTVFRAKRVTFFNLSCLTPKNSTWRPPAAVYTFSHGRRRIKIGDFACLVRSNPILFKISTLHAWLRLNQVCLNPTFLGQLFFSKFD